jgi:hypothetical protein
MAGISDASSPSVSATLSLRRLLLAWIFTGPLNPVWIAAFLFVLAITFRKDWNDIGSIKWDQVFIWKTYTYFMIAPCAIMAGIALFLYARSRQPDRDLTMAYWWAGLATAWLYGPMTFGLFWRIGDVQLTDALIKGWFIMGIVGSGLAIPCIVTAAWIAHKLLAEKPRLAG